MFSVIVVFLIVGISVYYALKKRHRERYFQFSEPPTYPFVGSSWHFVGKSPEDIFTTIISLQEKYGPNIQTSAPFTKTHPWIADADDIAAILTNPKLITKSSEYDFLRNWLGDGLLMSTDKKWHGRRKIITPTFHFKILEQFCEVFDKQGSVFVKCLEKHVDQESFNVFPYVANCSLDIICETAMGVTVNAQNDPSSQYVKTLHQLGKILFSRVFDPILKNSFIYQFTNSYREEIKATNVLHEFTDKVIKSRREELMKLKSNPEKDAAENSDDFGIKKRTAFLDLLLQYADGEGVLNDFDIREEVDTFMFEGQDTTASGIAFTLYNLAKYPEIQEKCFKECQAVFGNDFSQPTTMNDINNLQYLELVVKENLRYYPSVPMISRVFTEDTEINGKLIEKGADVGIMLFSLFRSPKYFEDPEKFWPERFEGVKDNSVKNTFSYIPFSAGSRNCVGQKFAMLEMKSTLSKILRHYELSIEPNQEEVKLMSDLILKPVNGIPLKIKRRNYI